MADGIQTLPATGEPLDHMRTGPPAWLLAALLAAALLPLFSTPLLPFIDFYNHLARYYVLAHLSDSAVLRQNYASHWVLLPNIGLDVIGTALLKLIPAWAAGHVLAVLILTTQFCGMMYFHRALTGRVSMLVAVLQVPLLYSYVLNWGFSNFLFGLGLAFAAAGWWLCHRDRGWRAVPLASLFAVGIFFTHAFAFGLYGLLLGSLELGLLLGAREVRATIWLRQVALIGVLAVLPIILFAATTAARSHDGLTNADESFIRLRASGALLGRLGDLVWYRLETILRVAEGPSFAADAAWSIAVAALLALLLVRRRLTLRAAAGPALIIGVILMALIPPTLFEVGFVADRVPLYVALLFAAALEPRGAPGGIDRAAAVGLGTLVALRLLTLAWDWQAYAHSYREFRAVAARLPPGSLVDNLMVGGSEHAARVPRCGMYEPLLVTQFGQVAPLFADPAKQPMLQIGPLAGAVAALAADTGGAREIAGGDLDLLLRRLQDAGHFDYVLVCNADRLRHPFPTNITVVAHTRQFALLRLR